MMTPARAGFALALCALAGASSVQAQDTAFTGATLIDGTGAAPVRDAVIVVRAGRIACVGTRAACPTAGAQVIDLAGRWVLPGLVDAHVHYSQTGWVDGRPDALDMRARFPYIETIARLRDPAPFYRANLCAGVTATFDVGGYPWTWRLRQDAENDPAAPHVAAAGPLLSTRDHWLNVPGERQFLFMPTDSATAEGARYLAANHTDAIKVWYLAGANSPDTAGLKQRLGVAAAEAQRSGIPLIVHATSLWAATQAVRNGAHLLVHGVGDRPVDDAFIEAARRAGTIYTPTLVVNAGYRQVQARRFDAAAYELECVDPVTRAKAFLTDSLPGRPDDAALQRSRAAAQRQDSLAALNLMRVHRAGIPVAMGTDAGNPLTLHGPSVYLEMEAMHAAGMSAMDVIVAATRNGARAMRREDDFGTLERGRIADMLILEADPLADIRNVRRVHRVVRAGRVWDRDQLVFPPAETSGPDASAWLPPHDSTVAMARADAALADSLSFDVAHSTSSRTSATPAPPGTSPAAPLPRAHAMLRRIFQPATRAGRRRLHSRRTRPPSPSPSPSPSPGPEGPAHRLP